LARSRPLRGVQDAFGAFKVQVHLKQAFDFLPRRLDFRHGNSSMIKPTVGQTIRESCGTLLGKKVTFVTGIVRASPSSRFKAPAARSRPQSGVQGAFGAFTGPRQSHLTDLK
jgi:hypothetical protein